MNKLTVAKSFIFGVDAVAVQRKPTGDDDPEVMAVDGPGLPLDHIYAATIAAWGSTEVVVGTAEKDSEEGDVPEVVAVDGPELPVDHIYAMPLP